MKIETSADPQATAIEAARFIAEQARLAVADRGRFTMALSGGSSPLAMLQALAKEDVPWANVDLFQVDERVAPAGDGARNLTQLTEALLAPVPIPAGQVHAMPVESHDLESAAAGYAGDLTAIAGTPPVLDLVHLGLGGDGHTASLVPGDPVLEVRDAEVAMTAPYQGRRRMTLTYQTLNRAARVLWLVTGEGKAAMLARLRAGDGTIPAGRVCADRAVVFADRAATA
jgi:6-phosphogluconolactonase